VIIASLADRNLVLAPKHRAHCIEARRSRTVEDGSGGAAQGGDRDDALALDLAITEQLHGGASGGSLYAPCTDSHRLKCAAMLQLDSSGAHSHFAEPSAAKSASKKRRVPAEGSTVVGAKAEAAATHAEKSAVRYIVFVLDVEFYVVRFIWDVT
jgi:hypothetical protein